MTERRKVGELNISSDALLNALTEPDIDGSAILQKMPSVSAQLANMESAGGDIRVPTGELIRAFSGSGAEDAVLPHLRPYAQEPGSAQLERSSVVGSVNETATANALSTEAKRGMSGTDISHGGVRSSRDMRYDKPLSGSENDEVSSSKEPLPEIRNPSVLLDGSQILINSHDAVVRQEKVINYALHPDQGKSVVFKSALGFDRSNADDLVRQIKEGVSKYPARVHDVDHHGIRFTVDIPVEGPKGRGTVRTGWIYRGQSRTPELTTLYVKKGRKRDRGN
jgi:hypothetical protein